jgi:hypothetical protein
MNALANSMQKTALQPGRRLASVAANAAPRRPGVPVSLSQVKCTYLLPSYYSRYCIVLYCIRIVSVLYPYCIRIVLYWLIQLPIASFKLQAFALT